MINRKYYKEADAHVKMRLSKFWWMPAILCVVMIALSVFLNGKAPSIVVQVFMSGAFLSMIVTIFMLVEWIKTFDVPRYDIPHMNVKSKRIARKIKRRFTGNVLHQTLKVTRKEDYGYALPSVQVYVKPNLREGYVLIENFGQYSKLNRRDIMVDVSGIISGKGISGFNVVNMKLIDNYQFIKLTIEDESKLKELVVKKGHLTKFKSKNVHNINLGQGLIWHAKEHPMMSIIARTGAGKSYFVGEYLAPLAKLQGWEVIYNSAKPDIYTKKYNGATKAESIVKMAEAYVKTMNKRLEVIYDKNVTDYADTDMKDIMLIFDEIGNLNAQLSDDKSLKKRWDSALKQLSLTGRAAGIHLVLISQYGTVEDFVSSSIRAQVSDVTIMLGSAAAQAEERRFIMGGFSDIPVDVYETGQGLAQVAGAGEKYEFPHLYKTPRIVD